MTKTGYSCDVDESWPPKLDTVIKLTEDQENWLQQNVIKSRKLKLLFRNETHLKFRAATAASRAGTFYLAQGKNGAILGAFTQVNMSTTPGWVSYGPGETIIFSVTNKKIYDYVGTTPKPMTTLFGSDESNLGFGVFEQGKAWDWGLVFLASETGWHNGWKAESYSGSRGGARGFNVGRDAKGNNMMTGLPDGYSTL